MARLYANENFPLPVVDELRRLGHDVLTMLDAGQAGRAVPDADVLRFAGENGRAVLTLNRRHFIRLHETDPGHAGVIVCTFDPDFAGQARQIDAVLTGESRLAGRLIRVGRSPGKRTGTGQAGGTAK